MTLSGMNHRIKDSCQVTFWQEPFFVSGCKPGVIGKTACGHGSWRQLTSSATARDASDETESSVLDISESINELLTPYQDRLNRENGYKVYIPEDKKVSVYEAYKDMTPEEFEAEMLRELEEEANGSYVLDDSDIMIGEHFDSPSDINNN